jgi:AraC family transcriptional regulator
MAIRPDTRRQRLAAVARAVESMKAGLDRRLSLGDLARAARFSPYHFHRIFQDETAVTPGCFLAALRMAEARRLLVHSSMAVRDVSTCVGYASLGAFTVQFGRLVGLPPARFRRCLRALRDERVEALLSAVPAVPPRQRGPVLVVSGALDGSRAVLVGGLCPGGCLPQRPASWAVAVAGARLPLPAAPDPGEYAVVSLVVPASARVVDAFVDGAPGSYLVGAARMRLPGDGGAVPVAVRRLGPTDPPMLAVAPLPWLVERSGC